MESVKKIRIGKTIQCKWAITTNGEVVSLENRDLVVMLKDPSGVTTNIPFTIERQNVVVFTVQGNTQKKLGTYSLSIWENKGSENQTVVDVDAFMLVSSTSQEN